jgi:hypothetical protein
MDFRILGQIAEVELVATGSALRVRKRLWRVYGKGRWRKLKGIAKVELSDGTIAHAEIHWYEAHGFGAKEHKIKRLVE